MIGTAPGWDRFARWPALPARLALIGLVLLLVASALVPIKAGEDKVQPRGFVENMVRTGPLAGKEPDKDLDLYKRAVTRIRDGENYYDFIAAEHRAAHYPLRPGVAVRLPTLAYVSVLLGEPGLIAAALALLAATMMAWWRRLGDEPGGRERRVLAMAFLFIGTSLGLNRHFFPLHELWAGMLLALSFGLHRPGRWGWALAAAAVALAIREHALPFVLLMAAMACWRRDWKEGAAWSALALVFLALLAVHLQLVAAMAEPGDRTSAPWLVMRGLSGWLSNVVLSSNLRFLPHWLAGPLVVLTMFGWAGWRSPAGTFGTLFYGGYGLAFMLAGRGDNYYWGVMVVPAILVGLVFVPRALSSLVRAARAN